MRLNEFVTDQERKISEQQSVVKDADIKDAQKVFDDWLTFGSNATTFLSTDIVFNAGLEKAKYQSIQINKLSVFHDWGRRPKSDNPIVVASVEKLGTIAYIILDGQHRFLAAKEANKKEINAYVIPMDVKWSRPSKKWLVGGNEKNIGRTIW